MIFSQEYQAETLFHELEHVVPRRHADLDFRRGELGREAKLCHGIAEGRADKSR